MLINFLKEMKDLRGEILKDSEEKPLTLKTVCTRALLIENSDPRNPKPAVSGEEKFNLYKLAVKIESSENSIEITAEDIVKIKKMVAEVWAPLISGQAFEMLESGSAI